MKGHERQQNGTGQPRMPPMRWAVQPRAKVPRTADAETEGADAPPGDGPERGVVTVEEER